eukprot:1664664-Ditylum_brightwellii.AAC.1
MTRTEKGNVKRGPSCITRDITVQENVIKDAKRWAKKRGLTCKEVKDLNAFVKDKIKERIKERNRGVHTMNDFKDLSISSSNESIQSIISDTSVEGSDDDSHKPANKK